MKVTTKQRLALTTLAVLAATTTSVWAVDASTVEYPDFDTLVVTVHGRRNLYLRFLLICL